MRNAAIFAAALLAVTATTPALGQEAYGPFAEINEAIEEIARSSPTFREALGRVPSGKLIVSYGSLPDTLAAATQYENGHATVFLDRSKVPAGMMQVALIHEIYGHAVPYIVDGVICRDPRENQSYSESCVAEREGRIMVETGRIARTTYPLR